jgi:hypothetical protein
MEAILQGWMTLLVILIVEFGLASGTIAHFKGYRFGGWFWLGALFGPFALIVIASLPLNRLIPLEVEEGPAQVCRHCRSWIPYAASICRFCRSTVQQQREAV